MKPLAAPASHGVLGQQEKQSVSIQALPAGIIGCPAGGQAVWEAGREPFHGALLFSRGSGALEGSESLLRGGRGGELQLACSSDFVVISKNLKQDRQYI